MGAGHVRPQAGRTWAFTQRREGVPDSDTHRSPLAAAGRLDGGSGGHRAEETVLVQAGWWGGTGGDRRWGRSGEIWDRV